MREPRYKVWNKDIKKLGDMVCLDLHREAGKLLTTSTHVSYGEDHKLTEKMYPCNYFRDITFLRCIGLDDIDGNPIYAGAVLVDINSNGHFIVIESIDSVILYKLGEGYQTLRPSTGTYRIMCSVFEYGEFTEHEQRYIEEALDICIFN